MRISVNWRYYFYTYECKCTRVDPARIYFFSRLQELSSQIIRNPYNIHLIVLYY